MAMNAPVSTTESEQLIGFLESQRQSIRFAAFGLTDEQARVTPSVSALSIGGLIKHVTQVETFWTDILGSRLAPFVMTGGYERDFRLDNEETLEQVLEEYQRISAITDETIRSYDPTHAVPIPQDVPWFPKDITSWNARWVALHLIEETARHAGHADIVRESIDGATALPLLFAAEGIPGNPFITPWEPALVTA